MKSQATCEFQSMKFDDRQAISVKYSQIKINTYETDTVYLFINEYLRVKNHNHIMQMKMCNSDKFLNYVKECAEIKIFNLN